MINQRSFVLAVGGVAFLGLSGIAFFLRSPPGDSSGREVQPEARIITFTYRFEVKDIPAAARQILAWVPLPVTNSRQEVLRPYQVTGNWPRKILVEPKYGNRFLQLDLSGNGAREGRDLTIAVNFQVKRIPYRVDESTRGTSRRAFTDLLKVSNGTADLAWFLAPNRLVPIDGKIAEEARRVTQASNTPFSRARDLYDHIVRTVAYDKSGQGWGRGDASYACDIRRGNCTDFHSLFIGEARALSIPSRFVIGFPIPAGQTEGEIFGYHCWAEFYLQDRGWVPIDASEAWKHPEKKEELFGGLDANRIEFTVGRDIQIPESKSAPVNYVIYPHVEIDGKPYKNVKTQFTFREETSASEDSAESGVTLGARKPPTSL